MIILYSGDPLNNKKPDMDYMWEYYTAQRLGIKVGLINFEELTYFDNVEAAVKRIEKSEEKEKAIFRGWMMTPEHYESLYDALLNKNIELINTPNEYKHCHYLPEVYPAIKEMTSKTVWLKADEFGDNLDKVWGLFDSFEEAVIIKDYVKSRKYEWEDACYIPDVRDRDNVKRVVGNFIKRQESNLSEGIVVREYKELHQITHLQKSKMPLSLEFRIFFINGNPMPLMNYWGDTDYIGLLPDLEPFLQIAKKIRSNFFTIDIALQKNGEWIIVEAGDGQVSGINDNYIEEFYNSLKENVDNCIGCVAICGEMV